MFPETRSDLHLSGSSRGSAEMSTDKPFAFVFGENVVHVPLALAELVSPRVSRLRRSDASVDRYVFQEGSKRASRAFEELVSYFHQGKLDQLPAGNLEILRRVADELENEEIILYLSQVTENATEYVLDPANLFCGIVALCPVEVTANDPDPHCGWLEAVTESEVVHEVMTYGPNPWICLDFRLNRVTPTAYVIQSGGTNFGVCFPRTWVIEVSNDGSEGSWEIIDSWQDCDGLNGAYRTCHFEIGDPPDGCYRFFRIRRPETSQDSDLSICTLDIYGTIFEWIRPKDSE